MNRRAFLTMVAGSPLVFGLRELLAQESTPDFVAQALKRMKETRRFGVFLVIPEADLARKTLGQGLIARMPNGSKAGRTGFELFCAHVFVCLDHEQAAKLGLGLKRGPDGILCFLVDPEGKQVAADRVALDVFEDSATFESTFKTFVHGADGERLRKHAATIEKGMADELIKAAGQLSPEGDEGMKAAEKLTAAADSIAPWLLQKCLESPGSPFERVLWTYYLQQSNREPEPALPFGLKVERSVIEDPCPPCGMAVYRPTAYKFISFYAADRPR